MSPFLNVVADGSTSASDLSVIDRYHNTDWQTRAVSGIGLVVMSPAIIASLCYDYFRNCTQGYLAPEDKYTEKLLRYHHFYDDIISVFLPLIDFVVGKYKYNIMMIVQFRGSCVHILTATVLSCYKRSHWDKVGRVFSMICWQPAILLFWKL